MSAAQSEQEIQRALAHHHSGRVEPARAIYRAILEVNPAHFNALQLLGVLELQAGNVGAGLALLEQALQIRPKAVATWVNHAMALQLLGRPTDALESIDRALALRPGAADALGLKAKILTDLARKEEAVACLSSLLTKNPTDLDALIGRSTLLVDLGRASAALVDATLAVKLAPESPELLNNRSAVLQVLERTPEALEDIDRAIALKENRSEFHNNRGSILHDLGRMDEALRAYARAVALDPGNHWAFRNRGDALRESGRFEEAQQDYQQSLGLNGEAPETWNNLGSNFQALGQYEEAERCYLKALELRPGWADAEWNRGLVSLLHGQFELGWKGFSRRWELRQMERHRRKSAVPECRSVEALVGRTVLLWAEQGLGDTLQFVRFLPRLTALGARVVLEVPEPLCTLLQSVDPAARVVPSGSDPAGVDLHCPLMDVAALLGTNLHNIPDSVPYLHPSQGSLESWGKRLGPRVRPRIGIAWSGNPKLLVDRRRSIPFDQFAPLLDLEAEFFTIQPDLSAPGHPAAEFIHAGGAAIRDFMDTAALISHMDLVISVDTAVAHLAGALGKPVWILLPLSPDWRWLVERTDSPWYPTARLFRNPGTGPWDPVITEVLREASVLLPSLR